MALTVASFKLQDAEVRLKVDCLAVPGLARAKLEAFLLDTTSARSLDVDLLSALLRFV